MAALTLSMSFSYTKGGTSHSLSLTNQEIDVSGTNSIHHRQTIGTSEEALQLGEVTAGGYMIIVNRDATNFVEIRPNTAVADLCKLKAGEGTILRLAADAVPYAIADTANCEVEYIIVED